MNCAACGDELPVKPSFIVLKSGGRCRIKKHCVGCFMELTFGVIPKGYVHHTDTRTGGGIRIMRKEKSTQ